jgi:hypothetical protein
MRPPIDIVKQCKRSIERELEAIGIALSQMAESLQEKEWFAIASNGTLVIGAATRICSEVAILNAIRLIKEKTYAIS